MKKVSGPQDVTPAEASEMPLPAEIQEALGELVGAAREGLSKQFHVLMREADRGACHRHGEELSKRCSACRLLAPDASSSGRRGCFAA